MSMSTASATASRHPHGTLSSLDERLRQGRECEHYCLSGLHGPVAYFTLLVRAKRDGDTWLADAVQERLRKLGWSCFESPIPERGGHP